MKKKVYLYRVWSWLRHQLTAWNTGGEGVHSPYLFEWVRMIMSDSHAYGVWDEIEAVRKQMLSNTEVLEVEDFGSGSQLSEQTSGGGSAASVMERRICDIAKSSLTKTRYAQMLFRLVNWLGHQLRDAEKGLSVVELGTCLGITTAYLAGSDSRDKVLTFEGSDALAKKAKENWKALGMNNVQCYVGEITADSLRANLGLVDVVFMDANHRCAATLEYFDVIASKVHEKSVIVVDDIHHSPEMEQAWTAICKDSRVTSTIDLYQMGLVFFDSHYWRRDYRMRL
jgi:predicted O-methyltransferase YrrM